MPSAAPASSSSWSAVDALVLGPTSKAGALPGLFIVGASLFVTSEFGARVWDKYLLQNFTEFQLFTSVTWIQTTISFWFLALLYGILDLSHRPKSLFAKKIQQTKSTASSEFRKATIVAITNQLLVNLPLSFAVSPLFKLMGSTAQLPLPHPLIIVRDFAVSTVVIEILFYYGHRALHHPSIYKYVHKMHHEFTAPMGVAAVYAHPIEHIMSNLIPAVAGSIIMSSHLFTFWLWMTLGVFTAISTHSGFVINGMANPLQHDFHHYRFNSNFGVVGWLDWLHGTDTGSAEYADKYYKRMKKQSSK